MNRNISISTEIIIFFSMLIDHYLQHSDGIIIDKDESINIFLDIGLIHFNIIRSITFNSIICIKNIDFEPFRSKHTTP